MARGELRRQADENKGIGWSLVGSGLMSGGCEEFGQCSFGSSCRVCRGEGWGKGEEDEVGG